MKTKVTIELEIEGYTTDAGYVVDQILDAGVLQDAISEHEYDAGPLRVTQATSFAAESERVAAHCTGGCGDIEATSADLRAGRCPACGRDLEMTEGRTAAASLAPIVDSPPPCSLREGWAIFNDDEIQRDDELKLFDCDDDAREHIRACSFCLMDLMVEADGLPIAPLLEQNQDDRDAERDA